MKCPCDDHLGNTDAVGGLGSVSEPDHLHVQVQVHNPKPDQLHVQVQVRNPKPDQEIERCPICFEDMDYEQIIIKMDCNHIYHQQCLKDWFTSQNLQRMNPTCPSCRGHATIIWLV